MKKFAETILFTACFTAILATMMAFQTAYVFHLPQNKTLLFFTFCGTLCSYNFHWALSPQLFQNPMHRRIISQKMHWIIGIISAIAAAFFFFQLPHRFALIVSGFLAAMYTAPKLQHPIAFFLRKIAVLKTAVLAFTWTYITVVLPLLFAGAGFGDGHALFFVNRLLLIYAICLLFDWRDREADKAEGIRSITTLYDYAKVFGVYKTVLVLFAITSLLLLFYLPMRGIIALLIPALVLLIFREWFIRNGSNFVYYFLIDGLMAISLPLSFLFGI